MVADSRLQYSSPAKRRQLEEVHAFLFSKATSKGKLRMIQQDLAKEFGMEKTTFHRCIAALVSDGRLRLLSANRKGDTVIVNPPE
jgi:hypothetical protein